MYLLTLYVYDFSHAVLIGRGGCVVRSMGHENNGLRVIPLLCSLSGVQINYIMFLADKQILIICIYS